MERMNKYLEIIKKDKEVGRRIFYISLLTALFILVLVIKNPDSQGSYLYDANGNVIGIQRESMDVAEEYSLVLSVPDGDEMDSRSVKITTKAQGRTDSKDSDTEEDQEVAREAEIQGIISDIESTKSKKITLPTRLSDGSELTWSVEKKGGSTWLLIIAFYVLLIILVVKSSIDRSQDEGKKNRKEIMKSLPRFTNQLLLMMNAGMILNDAFEKICQSYLLMDEDKKGFFERSVIQIHERNMDSRTSTALLISEFAAENAVKELMRISTILTENEKRGSDIIDNLNRESIYLWDERKIVARESGKLIDTKMSYPLGILLILLIVITMAPALLSM